MTNIRALRTTDITPEIVCDAVRVAVEAGTVNAIYVITIDHENQTTCYASGDLNKIGLAHVALTDLVNRYIHGEISEER